MTFTYGCKGQSENQNEYYTNSKDSFDSLLVSHFPGKLNTYPTFIVNSKDSKKNNIGFTLYEYDLNDKVIDSIENSLSNKSIAKYTPNLSCLLIVNRYETIDSYENRKDVVIQDSTKINKECYKNLYPVPNFINYNQPKRDSEIKLPNDFEIYVLEAKSGTYWPEFDLSPNPQMPKEWKNGYSRGIALSKKKNTVIYWAIVW